MKHVLWCIVLVFLVSGCAAKRMADLRDCGRFSVGSGLGLDASAKIGCVVHPSLGICSYTNRVGYEDRYRHGRWDEVQVVWPLFMMGCWIDKLFGATNVTPLASYALERTPPLPDRMEDDNTYETSWFPILQAGQGNTHDPFSFHEITDIEIGVTLGVVSVKAGINPLEIFDFFLGCVGFDIANDDRKDESLPN